MKILLLCAKGFETIEFSAFADVMGWARNDFGCPVSITTCGADKTVISTFGIPVVMDKLINEISADDFDALAVPGGFEDTAFTKKHTARPFWSLSAASTVKTSR